MRQGKALQHRENEADTYWILQKAKAKRATEVAALTSAAWEAGAGQEGGSTFITLGQSTCWGRQCPGLLLAPAGLAGAWAARRCQPAPASTFRAWLRCPSPAPAACARCR